jgi:hypothetical protein
MHPRWTTPITIKKYKIATKISIGSISDFDIHGISDNYSIPGQRTPNKIVAIAIAASNDQVYTQNTTNKSVRLVGMADDANIAYFFCSKPLRRIVCCGAKINYTNLFGSFYFLRSLTHFFYTE